MRLTEFVDIVKEDVLIDDEGFNKKTDTLIVSVRAYREGKHGSEMWTNLSTFSEATDLFVIRVIPNVRITTDMVLINRDERFEIVSVEEIKGRGLYIEILAKKVTSNGENNG